MKRGTAVGLALTALVMAYAFREVLADATGLLAAALTLGLIAVGLRIGQRLVWRRDWTRPVALLGDPVPETWAGIVRGNFPLSQSLTTSDFERLLKLIQVFLDKKSIEGAGGLEITEEIRVTLAAQACFLILWLDVGLYPALRSVIVYPSAVIPRYARSVHAHGALRDEAETPILGQSWTAGSVVLSWDSVRRGAFDPRDGKNVVFHEFAHQLDQETGEGDGVPVGMRLSALKPWAEVLETRFGELRRAERRGDGTVMDTYGAKNKAEFFAVATETFFEKPGQLRAKKPDLYALLVSFYGVDPAQGLRPVSPTPPVAESREAG